MRVNPLNVVQMPNAQLHVIWVNVNVRMDTSEILPAIRVVVCVKYRASFVVIVAKISIVTKVYVKVREVLIIFIKVPNSQYFFCK